VSARPTSFLVRRLSQRALLVLALGAAGVLPAAAAPSGVGVAAFEKLAPEGQSVPEVAGRLAQRLATRGIERVVGPEQLGVQATPEASPEQVVAWSQGAEVEALVVGRTTRLGRRLSVDCRVLDGVRGQLIGPPLVMEIRTPEEMGKAIDGLADRVLERLTAGLSPGGESPPAAPAPGAVSSPAPVLDGKTPISIRSDQLEAVEHEEGRHLVFTGNVVARQGPMDVHSDRLEVFYPEGGSSPDRLEAQGHVVLSQEGQTAHCQKAMFFRADSRVVCQGEPAELENRCDRVRGQEITFFLDTDVLHVAGDADVHIRESAGCSTEGQSG